MKPIHAVGFDSRKSYTEAMGLQPLRGFRDYYPESQARINWLRDKISTTCALFGYQEFEGPVVESFELYAAKSSDEIVNEQAFLVQNRAEDGEKMVLRPELTPTLARMVAVKQNQLVMPLRWWSFGRFWRYERPQKGRAREFYQWNCDILGDDSLNAEIELIELIIRFLGSIGLQSTDVQIELSDRAFINQLLEKWGIEPQKWPNVFRYLDKATKLSPDEQRHFAAELEIDIDKIASLTGNTDLWQESDTLKTLVKTFVDRGLGDWLVPNLTIVRGFNYYTGTVFEVSDRAKEYRAIIGGGRYQNLVADVGGQPVGGIGFGMGDMVILDFLTGKNLVPEYKKSARIALINLLTETNGYRQQIASDLREQGINVATIEVNNLGKGVKFADQQNLPLAILIGPDEVANQTLTLKDMTSGEQRTAAKEEIISQIKNR